MQLGKSITKVVSVKGACLVFSICGGLPKLGAQRTLSFTAVFRAGQWTLMKEERVGSF